jgi:7-carboxy-7-deazaguanine synthase
LITQGLRVVCYLNEDVLQNLDDVISDITRQVHAPPPTLPSPAGGEGPANRSWLETAIDLSPTGGEAAPGVQRNPGRPLPRGYVVLTGGEPMIMPEIVALARVLKSLDYHITVETAATVYKELPLDLASLSPKLSNSTPHEREGGRFAIAHEKNRINVPVIQSFIDDSPDFQLKFVVASEQDLAEIDALLDELDDWSPGDVLLMPEGIDVETLRSRAGWINDICLARGFRYSPRLHVELYGNKRGT